MAVAHLTARNGTPWQPVTDPHSPGFVKETLCRTRASEATSCRPPSCSVEGCGALPGLPQSALQEIFHLEIRAASNLRLFAAVRLGWCQPLVSRSAVELAARRLVAGQGEVARPFRSKPLVPLAELVKRGGDAASQLGSNAHDRRNCPADQDVFVDGRSRVPAHAASVRQTDRTDHLFTGCIGGGASRALPSWLRPCGVCLPSGSGRSPVRLCIRPFRNSIEPFDP